MQADEFKHFKRRPEELHFYHQEGEGVVFTQIVRLTGHVSVLVTMSRIGRDSSFPGRGTVLLSANPGNTSAYRTLHSMNQCKK